MFRFSSPPGAGIWVASPFCIITTTAIGVDVQIPESLFPVLLGICQEAELLGHMVILRSTFGGNATVRFFEVL